MLKKLIPLLIAWMLLTPSISLAQQKTQAELIDQIQTLLAFVEILRAQLAGFPPETSTNCANITNTLYYGRRDADTEGEVSILQRFLRDEGIFPPDLITGFYGPATESSVKRFQVDNNIISFGTPETTGYGVVGPRTREKILNNCTKPASQTGQPQTPTSNTTQTGQLALNLEINGAKASNTNPAVRYESNFNVRWSATGADRCEAGGSEIPIISGLPGGTWGSSTNLGTTGSAVLRAKSADFDVNPGILFVTVTCRNSSNRQISESAMVRVENDPNSPSTLSANAPTIDIISPDGGVWEVGSPKGISWISNIDTQNGGSVSATLKPYGLGATGTGSNTHTFISENYRQAFGSKLATMPANIAPGEYVIEVTITTPKGSTTEVSQSFEVKEMQSFADFTQLPGLSDTITIRTPSGGETFTEGSDYFIQWTGPVKKMRLMKGTTPIVNIGNTFDSSSLSGFYQWRVPSGQSGAGYSIQATSADTFDGTGLIGLSSQFTIETKPAPVTTPGTVPAPGTAPGASPTPAPAPTPAPVADTTPPSAPTGVKHTLFKEKVFGTWFVDITVSWNPSFDISGIKEYWVFENNKLVATTKDTSYEVSNIDNSFFANYKVVAIDNFNNSSPYSSETSVNISDPNH